MIILKGQGISEGVSFGTIFVNNFKEPNFENCKINDINIEIERYKQAEKFTLEYTNSLYEKMLKTVGKEEAEIFKSHEMMIRDKDFRNSIITFIKIQSFSAEKAILETSKKFKKFFSDMPDPYMKARALDIVDISKCMINYLTGNTNFYNSKDKTQKKILASKDFTPSEISLLSKDNLKGFLFSEGSLYSHSAILLRVMKIPGIICLKNQLTEELNGKYAVFDGSTGEVYVNPEDMVLNFFKNKKLDQKKSNIFLEQFKGKESISIDGKKVGLFCNMNNPNEIDQVLKSDGEGIGLLRSEFIYLNRDDYPSEETQYDIYKNILEKMNNKEVTIRTMDIGSDKKTSYFDLPFEHNPAMGYRGIRVCLDNLKLFKTQLRAIYKASVYGNVSIMFPMITCISEVKKIKKIISDIKIELLNEKIPFSKNIKIGVMIETPAAVMVSDEIAKEVDFFSIGTNDLTQYTLAVDRQNSKVGDMFDTHNKAVLRMIKIAIENAHKNNIKVCICGESASDESFLETYLALGVDKLSMSPPFILKMRKKILSTNVEKVKNKILSNI